MYTAAVNSRINEKSVSEYVAEVAYTAFYIDIQISLCVQEAGSVSLCEHWSLFERRGEGKVSLFSVRSFKYSKKWRVVMFL